MSQAHHDSARIAPIQRSRTDQAKGHKRDTNVTTAVNDVEKSTFEKLADVYDCSQAAMVRHLVEEDWQSMFGDIHPDALEHHDVDMEALIRGDMSPEDVPDKFKMDGDEPAQVPTTDGGAVQRATPSSYTPTYTPQDLAQSGVELTWDELKDAVDRHWSAKLEIHEDRVRPGGEIDVAPDGSYNHDEYALRASKATVTKILAGILRGHSDTVPEKLVEATILQYTEHQITRVDEDAGRQYKKSEYKRLLVDELEYLVPHPDPLKDEYYTSEQAAKDLFAEEVEETIAELIDKTWVLDPREHVQQTGIAVKDDAEQWVRDLAEFRQQLGFLQAVTTDETWSDWLEEVDDPVGDLVNARVAAAKTYNELLQQYVRVNPWARFAAAHAVLDVDDDIVLTDEVSRDGEFVDVNADNPTQPMTEWVQRRETPLSPAAQIDAVSKRL